MIQVWICCNLALALAALTMLTVDIGRRHRLGLSLRFYWQAVALLLVSVIVGSVKVIIHPIPADPVRLTLTSVAVIYLIISVMHVSRDEKERGREKY